MSVLAMLRIVPSWCYWILILVALCLGCEIHGAGRVQAKWDAEKRSAATVAKVVTAGQDVVLRQVVTNYVDRVKTITVQGETRIKEVPIYVTAQDDAACSINAGFVRMWNAANAGTAISPNPSGADEAPSGVSLSDTAAQHDREATYTHQIEEQLIALQDAVSGIQAVAAAAANK
ncbi:hypothetical protein G5S34_17220 [Herbaspirillum frisingense]|uniref:hypothetical protein n=1 Tax=Herbaspirillum frisingense TaxID=92645 RepID=UPI001602AF50|nr:hypothetical protein [Herbaspirillum frisingense]QNB08321.1 hypothetical protein G5S34_17220 [Herbaspirillum frisingense]